MTIGASGFAIELVVEATSPAALDLPGEQATQRDTVAKPQEPDAASHPLSVVQVAHAMEQEAKSSTCEATRSFSPQITSVHVAVLVSGFSPVDVHDVPDQVLVAGSTVPGGQAVQTPFETYSFS